MTDEYQKAIDLLIDTFDFEKVHIYMALTGWTYRDSGKTTPSIEDLKKTARGLLEEIAISQSRWGMTGGFRVDIYRDPVELSLSFVAVEDSVYV
jgi:hypothetical protein